MLKKMLLIATVLLCSNGCGQPQKESWFEREWRTFTEVNIPRAKEQAARLIHGEPIR